MCHIATSLCDAEAIFAYSIFASTLIRFVWGSAMSKPLHDARYKRRWDLLIEARGQKGLSQRDLASFLNEDQSYVSKCERGIRRLDVIELRDWVSALGLKFGTFAKRLEAELENATAITKHTAQDRKSLR